MHAMATQLQRTPHGPLIVDDDWVPILSRYRWYVDSKPPIYAYAVKEVGGVRIKTYMHRWIAQAPAGHKYEVDHINENKLDNRESNLRLVNRTRNNQGRKTRNATSRFRGVSRDRTKGLWLAQCAKDGEQFYLGRYDTEEDAAQAYDEKAKELYGSKAKLNFPDG